MWKIKWHTQDWVGEKKGLHFLLYLLITMKHSTPPAPGSLQFFFMAFLTFYISLSLIIPLLNQLRHVQIVAHLSIHSGIPNPYSVIRGVQLEQSCSSYREHVSILMVRSITMNITTIQLNHCITTCIVHTQRKASGVNSDRNTSDCGRCLDSFEWFNVWRSCQANLRPHIMTVFRPDHKEVRDSRHVWPAMLRVNFIQQHRFPSVYIRVPSQAIFNPFLIEHYTGGFPHRYLYSEDFSLVKHSH